ncbi:MAG TPA: flagellar hook-length control protein FliK [Candidatus Binatia bacterium]|jgi:flagellar hook-length control protein FliK
MMLSALSASAPAVLPTDDNLAQTKNATDTSDFSALLLSILGFASLPNVTAQSEQQAGFTPPESIPANPQSCANALLQGTDGTSQSIGATPFLSGVGNVAAAGAASAVEIPTAVPSPSYHGSFNAAAAPAQGAALLQLALRNSDDGDSSLTAALSAPGSGAPPAALAPQAENLPFVGSSSGSANLPQQPAATTPVETGVVASAPAAPTPAAADFAAGINAADLKQQITPAITANTKTTTGDAHAQQHEVSESLLTPDGGFSIRSDPRSATTTPTVTDPSASQPVIRAGSENGGQKVAEVKIPAPDHEQRLSAEDPGTRLAVAHSPGAQSTPTVESQKPLNPGPVVQQVADGIAANVRENRHQAVLDLNPPDLGRVRINLTLDGGKLEVHILAEAHESRNLLQNHLPELKQALQMHQLDLAEVRFDNSNWSGSMTDLSQGFERTPNNRQQSGSAANGGEPTMAIADAQSAVEAPAPAGGRVSMWA